MKTINVFVLAIAATGLVTFASCKKDHETVKKSTASSIYSMLKDGDAEADVQISIIADRTIGADGNVSTNFHFEGYAPAGYNAGDLTVGSTSVPYADGAYSWFATPNDALDNYFGKDLAISATGSDDFDAFNVSQYIPQPLDVTFSGINANREISASAAPTINWTVDATNDANFVVVVMQSEPEDGTAPVTIYRKVQESQGHYTFTDADMSAFTVGHRIRMYIGRGNDQEYTVGSKTLDILALLTCAGYRLTLIS